MSLTNKIRIAHLSDPHFGTVFPEKIKALTAVLDELSPQLIVISGDITQRARRSQFAQASAFIQSLSKFSTIAIPGNHDIPMFNVFARLFFPYAGFRKMAKSTLGREKVIGGVQVLALNSTSRFRTVQGALDLTKLENALSTRPKDVHTRIVFFHHPMDCPHHVDKKNLLKNREAVLKILEKHEVDMVLGGHIHDPLVTLSTDTYKNVERPLILGVAGTCLSWRIRAGAPNSFNVIEVETSDISSPKVSVSRYDLAEANEFRWQTQKDFQRSPNLGWNSN